MLKSGPGTLPEGRRDIPLGALGEPISGSRGLEGATNPHKIWEVSARSRLGLALGLGAVVASGSGLGPFEPALWRGMEPGPIPPQRT